MNSCIAIRTRFVVINETFLLVIIVRFSPVSLKTGFGDTQITGRRLPTLSAWSHGTKAFRHLKRSQTLAAKISQSSLSRAGADANRKYVHFVLIDEVDLGLTLSQSVETFAVPLNASRVAKKDLGNLIEALNRNRGFGTGAKVKDCWFDMQTTGNKTQTDEFIISLLATRHRNRFRKRQGCR